MRSTTLACMGPKGTLIFFPGGNGKPVWLPTRLVNNKSVWFSTKNPGEAWPKKAKQS